MVEVVIKGIVVTHQYGTLNTGDVLRTDKDFAKHLVEDCGAAEYRSASVANGTEEVPVQVQPLASTTPEGPAPEDSPAPAKPGRKPRAQ